MVETTPAEMTNRLIFRIEKEDETGIYASGDLWMPGDDDMEARPHPEDDIPGWTSMSEEEQRPYRFGFASQSDMLAWFFDPDEWAELHAAGFLVAVYEVPRDAVIDGERQVAFRGGRRVRIEAMEGEDEGNW